MSEAASHSYNSDVSSVNSLTFVRLLLKWKGSIFKSVKWELFTWIIAFYAVHVIYKYCLTTEYQRLFEETAADLDKKLDYIPLTFMLGFFVAIVVDRWRNVFQNLEFIDNVAFSLNALLHDEVDDTEPRLIRRAVVRYLILSQVLVLREVSLRVRRRFAGLGALVEAGLVHEDELRMLGAHRHWLPISWANALLQRALRKRFIDSPVSMNNILNTCSYLKRCMRTKRTGATRIDVKQNIKEFRTSLEALVKYDWVPIPIAYPQTGTPFPFMSILQFIFFVGWMKVAEALLNPLGEDDDDLECNWLIDRNLLNGLEIVDLHHSSCPPLRVDGGFLHTTLTKPAVLPLAIAQDSESFELSRMSSRCMTPEGQNNANIHGQSLFSRLDFLGSRLHSIRPAEDVENLASSRCAFNGNK